MAFVAKLLHDAHDGTVAAAAAWLQANVDGYRARAMSNDPLLVVTTDEHDMRGQGNQISTLLVGPIVQPGQYSERIDRCGLLRTLEALYGLGALGEAANRAPVTDVWASAPWAAACGPTMSAGPGSNVVTRRDPAPRRRGRWAAWGLPGGTGGRE